MGLSVEKAKCFRSVVDENDLFVYTAQADADSLASAVVVSNVVAKIKDCDPPLIIYEGRIGKHTSQQLVNELELSSRIIPSEKIGKESIEGREMILVDSSSTEDSRVSDLFRGIRPAIILDHHESKIVPKGRKGEFYWIDNGVSAASTLVYELAKSLKIELSREDSIILAVGIHIDARGTENFVKRDKDAYGELTEEISDRELRIFLRPPKPRSYYNHLACAINNREEREAVLVMNSGRMPSVEGDDLAMVADHVAEMENIAIVLTFGILADIGKVRLCIRSGPNSSISRKEFLEKLLSKVREYGGDFKVTPMGEVSGGGSLDLSFGEEFPWIVDSGSRPSQEKFDEAIFLRICEWVFDE